MRDPSRRRNELIWSSFLLAIRRRRGKNPISTLQMIGRIEQAVDSRRRDHRGDVKGTRSNVRVLIWPET
jgi:hypothetical protein